MRQRTGPALSVTCSKFDATYLLVESDDNNDDDDDVLVQRLNCIDLMCWYRG